MLYFYLCIHIMAYIQGLYINISYLSYFFIVLCSFWRPIVNIISPIFIRLYLNIPRRIIGFYIVYPTRHLLHVIRPNMHFHITTSYSPQQMSINVNISIPYHFLTFFLVALRFLSSLIPKILPIANVFHITIGILSLLRISRTMYATISNPSS